ncbi:DNASE2 [Mytilus coruscus]|uniref:DNASE2 n=1 Tax=Mytilus coruscus TaxID=42192 RepID=A0A6J8EJJ0_MYTCO|nr:DNASE2 [Mytilus coruscus]
MYNDEPPHTRGSLSHGHTKGMYNDEPPHTRGSLTPGHTKGMYNDEPPHTRGSLTHGHTKGIYNDEPPHNLGDLCLMDTQRVCAVGFDKTDGFWLVHSTPKFPYPKSEGYKFPSNGDVYGQTFLCVSMNYDMLDILGSVFLYSYPTVYDSQLPNSYFQENPNMVSILTGRQNRVKQEPWFDETLLLSKGRHYFRSFAKSAEFHKDLYDGWLSSRLKYELLVETWQNGRGDMGSNCTVGYKNTQFKRGGGQVCFQNNKVWTAFVNLVTDYDTCSPLDG